MSKKTKKKAKHLGCQQVLLHPDKDLRAILEYLCGEANKVFNCSVYYARQVWFKENRFVKKGELCGLMKWNRHFNAMYASSAQQICNGVVESFSSFRELLKLFWKGEFADKPKPPNYRKPGLFTVSYPKKWLKITDKGIRVPLGRKVKAWFGLEAFYIPMASNLDWDSIKEIRILPRHSCFYTEFVYEMKIHSVKLDQDKAISIDHGLNNWLTCVDTQGNSFIIDGKHLKSKNQWYNKQIATIKENKPQGFWSKRLARITEKRNRQMRDAVNKAARLIINHCLKNGIGTVVFGWNNPQGAKDQIDVDGSVYQTMRNGGEIEIVFERSVVDRLKIALLIDNGGWSMEPHVEIVQTLFSSTVSQFKDLNTYFFHNTIYDLLWQDPARFRRPVPLDEFVQKSDPETRLIIVGDASMAPYELMATDGSIHAFERSGRPSVDRLHFLAKSFPHAVWLNPVSKRSWDYTRTIGVIRSIFPMFELSLDGLEQAVNHLVRK